MGLIYSLTIIVYTIKIEEPTRLIFVFNSEYNFIIIILQVIL